MNNISILGRVATDPETRQAGTQNVTRLRIAVDRPGKDAGADFFTVKCWGKQSDVAAKYLSKGKQVGIEGNLRNEEWTKDGQKQSRVEIVARRIQLIGGGGSPAGGGPEAYEDPLEDGLPI